MLLLLLACEPDPWSAPLPEGVPAEVALERTKLPSLPLAQPRIAAYSFGFAPSVCVLDVEGWLTCTEVAGEGDVPPEGRFVDVVAGGLHHCALDPEGRVACWGNPLDDRTASPEGAFVQLGARDEATYALAADGSVTSWGASAKEIAGQDTLVLDGAECLGQGGRLLTAPPEAVLEGGFSAVAYGRGDRCGLRADGSLTCFSRDWVSPKQIPGPWQGAVFVGGDLVALDASGTAQRLSGELWSPLGPKGGAIDLVSTGQMACLLYEDASFECVDRTGKPKEDQVFGARTISSRPEDPERTAGWAKPEPKKATIPEDDCERYTACVCGLSSLDPQFLDDCTTARALLGTPDDGMCAVGLAAFAELAPQLYGERAPAACR